MTAVKLVLTNVKAVWFNSKFTYKVTNMKNLILESVKIIKEVKWDYANLQNYGEDQKKHLLLYQSYLFV